MRSLRAFVLLSLDGMRRLLREGIVLRSLVFPVVLTILAVVGTVAVVLWIQAPRSLALSPEAAHPELVAAVEADGDRVVVVADPGQAVRDDEAAIGTDGTTLWIGNGGHPPLRLEAKVREHLGTVWRPYRPEAQRKASVQNDDAPRRLAVFIGALFALYGVVFGAGGVARDRDQGTLDAELAMPVPHVVVGFARWTSGTLVLSAFFAMSVGLVHAIMGVGDPTPLILHGGAACGASTAIGLLVIGRAGLDRGFAGPMSAGLVAVFGLAGAGLARGPMQWVPIASLLARDASAWPPVLGAIALGVVAALAFARRTAVT